MTLQGGQSQPDCSKEEWEKGYGIARFIGFDIKSADACNEKKCERKQKKEAHLPVFLCQSIEDTVGQKNECVIEDIEESDMGVITDTLPVIEGEHADHLEGGYLEETEGDDENLFPIRIAKGLFHAIEAVELIQTVIENPRTKADEERKKETIEFSLFKESPLLVEPEQDKT